MTGIARRICYIVLVLPAILADLFVWVATGRARVFDRLLEWATRV